ncbi:MAG: alpha/beta hydrolase [Elsteraceae bacterium]
MIDTLARRFRRHAESRARFRPMLLGGFALMTLLSGCSALGAIDALTPDNGYRLRADVAYGDKPRQKLDVYRPEKPGGPAPVIVFFYGGGWRMGDRNDYRFVGQAFASDGYVVVTPDYRLYPDVRFPGFVEDGAAAVVWTQRNIAAEGGDPNRIILIGHSAGAHLVSMLHADRRFLDDAGFRRPADGSSGLAATIGMAGPYNYTPQGWYRDILNATAAGRPVMPLPFVEGREPPLLLLHGESDSTVYVANTNALAEKTKEKGGKADVRLYSLGHGPLVAALAQPLRWLGPVHDDILVWLRGQGLAP